MHIEQFSKNLIKLLLKKTKKACHSSIIYLNQILFQSVAKFVKSNESFE